MGWGLSVLVGCLHFKPAEFSGFSSRQEKEIIVITPPKPDWVAIGKKLKLRGVYVENDEIQTDQEYKFEFRGNPIVESVHPQEAIAQ